MNRPGSDHTQRASLPSRIRAPRLAAGRARALGLPTRGTTNANRLRRVDRWVLATQLPRIRDAARPLVVDLGYGSSAGTTLQLADRPAPPGAGPRGGGVGSGPAPGRGRQARP